MDELNLKRILLSNLKKVKTEYLLYACVFNSPVTGGQQLFIDVSNSLDELYSKFVKKYDPQGKLDYRPILWGFMPISEIIHKSIHIDNFNRDFQIGTEKNLLMKKIIDNKDKSLLKSNKDLFTENELKFIKSKFKNHDDTKR